MATLQPCPAHELCGDTPLANLSAELPDVAVFTGVFFPAIVPPLNQLFIAQGCLSKCTSTISQEDANICAANQAAACKNNPCPSGNCDSNPPCVPGTCGGGDGTNEPPTRPPNGNPCPPPQVCHSNVSNTPQSCCAVCPDGSPFCFTVPAGTFFAATVAEANAIAHSYACKQAAVLLLCIFGNPPAACAGQDYSAFLTASGGAFQNFAWSIISGSLPPGLTGAATPDTSQFVISGNPTTAGVFTFTVRVDDVSEKGTSGSFSVKTFTIGVMAITSGAPPDAPVNEPYAFQMTVEGGVPPYNFFATALPPGLSLTSEGLITGTPTEPDIFIFDLCVSDSSGGDPCCQTVSLTVTGQFKNTEQKYGCPDLHGPTVHGAPFFTVAAGTITSNISQEDADAKAKQIAQDEFFAFIFGGGNVVCCDLPSQVGDFIWSVGCSGIGPTDCDTCTPTVNNSTGTGTFAMTSHFVGATTFCSTTWISNWCCSCPNYNIVLTFNYVVTFTDHTAGGASQVGIFYNNGSGHQLKVFNQNDGDQTGSVSFPFTSLLGNNQFQIQASININGGSASLSGSWSMTPLARPCQIY